MRLTDEQRKFAEENHDLIYSFMRKLKLDDEWYGAVAIGYVKAIATFDPEKAEFSTYAYNCMSNAVNLVYRKPQLACVSLNEIVHGENGSMAEIQDFIPDIFDYSVDVDATFDIYREMDKLPVKKKKAMLMKAMGYNGTEIGRHFGFSRAYADRIVQEARQRMQKA